MEDLYCCSLKETTHGVGLPTARLAKPGIVLERESNVVHFQLLQSDNMWPLYFYMSIIYII